MIKIVAKAVVKEEMIEEFHKAAAPLVEASATEEGNISYSLNQNVNDKCRHAFIEIWKDQDAIEKHNASEHFTGILPKLAQMCDGELDIELYKEV